MAELDALLATIEQYVTLCCLLETPPRVSELAQIVGVSAGTLARQARRNTISLAAALKHAQLVRAEDMLCFSDASMTRIAYACGFGTRRTFFRAFQRAFGGTPAQYRDSIRESAMRRLGGDVG